MIKKFIIIFSFLIFTPVLLINQSQSSKILGKDIYFDAVCFKSNIDTLSRIDIFTIVPYQTLFFVKSGDIYSANFTITASVYNENGDKIKEETREKSILEKDYYITQGGRANFSYSQIIFHIPRGKYNIVVQVYDTYSKKTYQKSRNITALNFSDYLFAISSLLIASSIEQSGDRNIVTPHLSDNVGDLSDGFFIFFETYNSTAIDSADFVYEIYDNKNKLVERSKKTRLYVKDSIKQHYIKIPFLNISSKDSYTIKLLALNKSESLTYSENDILALSERSIRFEKTLSSYIMEDLDKAITQLRYVANQSEIDYINSAENKTEKERRFIEFWKNLDPSPNTERNEAFEQYYSRIEYANKVFRSYTEGWRTDKGMVYIIFGRPINEERYGTMSDGRILERWTYSNGKQFIFIDNSGFGDFRLYSPQYVYEKYKYSPGE